MQKIKRYVTGHDADGKAIVTHDDHAPNAVALQGWPGAGVTEIWVTGEMPVDNMGTEDQSLRPLQHDPVAGGTIFRVVEIPPEGDFDHRYGRDLPPARFRQQADFGRSGKAPDHAQDRFGRLPRRHIG